MKKNQELFKKLKQYMEIEGMSRYEDDVVAALKNNTKTANLEYQRDGLGSLIMTKKGQTQGPKILLAAHMDEVGFIVLDILDNGQLKVYSIGGVWPNAIIGSKAKLIASDGKIYYGIFGHTSIHIMEPEKVKLAVTKKDLFVDFGFKDKAEAEKLNIQPGNRIYFAGETIQLANPDLVGGKAMDNRAGITVLDLVANALKDDKTPNQPYIVGTVQEEVGCRGAKTTSSFIDADIAFAIDTGASHDTFGAIEGTPKLGKGVALSVADGGTLTDPKLMEYVTNLAKKHNIPVYPYIAQGGGTDAEELQFGKRGVPTLGISIPTRYLHSPIGVASMSDIQACVDLMVAFIREFDQKEFDKISYK